MLPSASSWDRIMACSQSSGGGLVEIRRDGARAARGTAVHSYLEESMLSGCSVPSMASELGEAGMNEAEVAALISLDIRSVVTAMLGDGRPDVELAMALNTVTAAASARLRSASHRDYSGCDAESIPGTVDLIWETGDCVYVCDYKTSLAMSASELLDHHRWQLTVLALAHIHSSKTTKRVQLCVIHVDDEAVCRRAVRDFDVFEQVEAYDAIAARARALGVGAHTPGTHCKYCPKYDACPATVGLVREIVKADPQLPVNWGDAYAKVRQLKILVDALDGRMKEHVRLTGGIELAGGKVYGPVQMSRTSISPYNKDIRRILKEHGAESAIVLEQKVTQDSLRTALGGSRPKLREVMGQLREAGAITEKTYEVVKEHKQGAKASEEG